MKKHSFFIALLLSGGVVSAQGYIVKSQESRAGSQEPRYEDKYLAILILGS